jgi:hypothetical protein
VKIKRIALFIVVVCLAFFILSSAKNEIAKSLLINAVGRITGLGVQVQDMQMGLFKTWVNIDGLYLFNPSGFSDRLMADMPRVYIDYDLGSFFRKQVHLSELDLVLREFIVVKGPDGRLNVNSIRDLSKPAHGAEPVPTSPPKKPDIRIDILRLKIGRVLYKDYTQMPPAISEFAVNIDERYENITDPDKLVKLIVTRALVNTAISNLAEMDFSRLESDISGIIKRGKGIFKSGDIEDLPQVIEGVAQQLENIFKLPSGK